MVMERHAGKLLIFCVVNDQMKADKRWREFVKKIKDFLSSKVTFRKNLLLIRPINTNISRYCTIEISDCLRLNTVAKGGLFAKSNRGG